MKSQYKPDRASCQACQHHNQWNPCTSCLSDNNGVGLSVCEECCWNHIVPCFSCTEYGGIMDGTEINNFKEIIPPSEADVCEYEAEEAELKAEAESERNEKATP